jgi:hypothetical protein
MVYSLHLAKAGKHQDGIPAKPNWAFATLIKAALGNGPPGSHGWRA